MFKNLCEKWSACDRRLLRRGMRVMAVHRLSHWRCRIDQWRTHLAFAALPKILKTVSEVFAGIALASETNSRRGFRIDRREALIGGNGR